MTKDQENILSQMNSLPSVLMFMGTQCTFCGPMMQLLTEIMKSGRIADLHVVNIEANPELARQHGVRSVPWLQIGPFELAGTRTKKELLLWIERASSFEGISDYLEEVLAEGKIESANKLIQRYPQALENVIDLMADPEAKINVRLGVGVIIEDMAATEAFKVVTPRLVEYLSNDDARIRGDACHYLSLTKDVSYISAIKNLLSDKNEEVREIAQDSLDELLAE